MKKILLVLVILGLTTAVFAQNVALTGHLSTGSSGVSPSIGAAFDMGTLDILAEIEFAMRRYTNYIGEPNERTSTTWLLGIYAGVAPKVEMTERLTLSVPILVKFIYSAYGRKFKDSSWYTLGGDKDWSYNTLGIDAGARAYYALSQKWSVFMGFQAAVITYIGETEGNEWVSGGGTIKWKSADSELLFFHTGTIDLGVKFSF